MNKMDDARRASAERDALRKPFPEDLLKDPAADAEARAAYRRARASKRGTLCPDCPDSVAFLRWDKFRKLWVHERCGGTWTIEELETFG